jgi:hypothetical protein
VSRRLRGGWAVGLLALVAAGPAVAFQVDVAQYYDAAKDVCRTGVTPAMRDAYERARRAMDRAHAAPGVGFAGLKAPEQLWLDCFQSPGDGKT